MKKDIEGKLAASSLKVGPAAFCGVFVFTLLMITREGMETAHADERAAVPGAGA